MMDRYDDEDDEINEESVNALLFSIADGTANYISADDAISYYNLLMDLERIDDARTLLDYAISLNSNDQDLLLTKSIFQINMGLYPEAENILDFLVKEGYNRPPLDINFGWLNLKKGLRSEAIRYFEKAVQHAENDDEQISVLEEIANNTSNMGMHDIAVKFYEQINPEEREKYEDVELQYAFSLDKLGRNDEAIAAYRCVLKTNPLTAEAWCSLALVLARQEDIEGATEANENALGICPVYADPYFNLGCLSYMQFDWLKVIDNFTDYISLADDIKLTASSYVFIGEAWKQLDNIDLSYRFFEMGAKLEPELSQAWFHMGVTTVAKGDVELGFKYMDKAIELDPTEIEYYTSAVETCILAQSYLKAYNYAQKGLLADPDNITLLFQTVNLLIVIKDSSKQTIDNFFTVKKSEIGNPPALQFVEAYFIYNRNKAKAIKMIDEILSQSPQTIIEASKLGVFADFLKKDELNILLIKHNIQI